MWNEQVTLYFKSLYSVIQNPAGGWLLASIPYSHIEGLLQFTGPLNGMYNGKDCMQ